MTEKNCSVVPQDWGTMDHWVEHNKYGNLAKFVPPQIAGGDKIQRTSLISTMLLSLLFKLKIFFYFHSKEIFSEKNFSNMCYKISGGHFPINCS